VNQAEFKNRLTSRAATAGLVLPLELVDRLHSYYELLTVWNRKINLTAASLEDLPADAIDRLFIEPVAAAQYATRSGRVIDIGSGGGSPAIPFALASRATHLTMVESRTRKSVFLKEAARIVAMPARVITARYEEVVERPELCATFDVATVRAVRVEESSLRQLARLLVPAGSLFLFVNRALESIPQGMKTKTHQLTGNSVLQVLR
jgi:16S rRNA (guanine527-N7)-methyltransferase